MNFMAPFAPTLYLTDICQFVPFKEYLNAPPERLGAKVLQELPGNIVEFFVGSCDPPIMPGQRPLTPGINC